MSIPLSQLEDGQRATILRSEGGAAMAQRLAGLGLLPGSEFTVVRSGGPAIVEVLGNRVVIGRGMASRIIVNPLP